MNEPVEMVAPSIVPMSYNVGTGEANGQPILALTIYTPAGQTVVFMDPGAARNLAMILIEAAKAAGTRLIVPAAVVPPDIRGPKGNGR